MADASSANLAPLWACPSTLCCSVTPLLATGMPSYHSLLDPVLLGTLYTSDTTLAGQSRPSCQHWLFSSCYMIATLLARVATAALVDQVKRIAL